MVEVALVSGHRDWNMLRRYTHLSPERLHDKAMPMAVVEKAAAEGLEPSAPGL